MRDLEKPNSEDAVTWSVFRLLETKFSNCTWLAEILNLSGCTADLSEGNPHIHFWEKGYPSTSRLLMVLDHLDEPCIRESRGVKRNPNRYDDLTANREEYRKRIKAGHVRGRTPWVLEGPTEFDAVIRTPREIIAVEAKLYSDISTSTMWDTSRDQIARVIDTGSVLAKEHALFFLLITDHYEHHPSKKYEGLIRRYRTGLDFPSFQNRIGWLTWGDIYKWLVQRNQSFTEEQREWIGSLYTYLLKRKLITTERRTSAYSGV